MKRRLPKPAGHDEAPDGDARRLALPRALKGLTIAAGLVTASLSASRAMGSSAVPFGADAAALPDLNGAFVPDHGASGSVQGGPSDSLLATPSWASGKVGSPKVLVAVEASSTLDERQLEASHIVFGAVRSKLDRLMTHLPPRKRQPMVAALTRGDASTIYADSTSYASLARQAKQVEGDPGKSAIFFDRSNHRVVIDASRFFDPSGERISEKGWRGLTSLLAQPRLTSIAEATNTLLRVEGKHPPQIAREFQNAAAGVVRHLLDPEAAKLSKTSSEMIRQVGADVIAHAFLAGSDKSIRKTALAFSAVKYAEKIEKTLGKYLPDGPAGFKSIKEFVYSSRAEFKPTGHDVDGKYDLLRRQLWVNTEQPRADESLLHELLHSYESRTSMMLIHDELSEAARHLPHLRDFDVPTLFSEGFTVVMGDRIAKTKAVYTDDYDEYGRIFAKHLEKHGDDKMLTFMLNPHALLDPDAPADYLQKGIAVELDEVIAAMKSDRDAPTRHTEL
ncbi:hypothetical protein [Methylibium sp.]|uniref:hypothetical protein n=1 Tax=Methylibium sp. TaxID=2067992 RepID=UPI002DBBC9F7|nr:hypothetical protein [Methylibium sp.]